MNGSLWAEVAPITGGTGGAGRRMAIDLGPGRATVLVSPGGF
jgi:hypothetical protein